MQMMKDKGQDKREKRINASQPASQSSSQQCGKCKCNFELIKGQGHNGKATKAPVDTLTTTTITQRTYMLR